MAWNLDSDRPIYTQILERIQLRIVNGVYEAGEKIPSVRELAAEAGVNPNTMQKALAELERSGLVMAQRTSKRVVTEDKQMIWELRQRLAQQHVTEFMGRMEKLGFQKNEIMRLLAGQEGGEQ